MERETRLDTVKTRWKESGQPLNNFKEQRWIQGSSS